MFGPFCEFLFLIFGVFVYFISKKKKQKTKQIYILVTISCGGVFVLKSESES